ncbi:MAG: oxidoreductase [Phycisphaeraceae bacterium]|nr:MAG: oxidoreductase [Phycisphaeraceae bacterium]
MSTAVMNYAMIGGGKDSFIGGVHRKAAALDGRTRLVAGAFSSTPERSLESARAIGVPEDRAYGSWREMLSAEADREKHGRVDFVSIVTPNHMHFAPAKAALEAGFHVVCDKPFTLTPGEAEELIALADARNLVCAVTYNYTGFPMIRHAAELCRTGQLGTIRKVFVEYHQGWLATALESTGMKQAAWRTDPAKAGLGGSLGDIGTHAENLISFVTGLEIESLCADLTSFVHGRELDDDAAVLIRFADSIAKGVLTCSQVCVGEGNALSLRVYGDAGGLTWRLGSPDNLVVAPLEGDPITLTRGGDQLCDRAKLATRLPPGHPEGFIEAFANIYLGVVEAIEAKRSGCEPTGLGAEIPTATDGLRGVRFVETCVESAREGNRWVEFS